MGPPRLDCVGATGLFVFLEVLARSVALLEGIGDNVIALCCTVIGVAARNNNQVLSLINGVSHGCGLAAGR